MKHGQIQGLSLTLLYIVAKAADWGIPFFVPLGLALVGLGVTVSKHSAVEFASARWCFLIAAGIFGAEVFCWEITTTMSLAPKIGVACAAGFVCFFVIPAAINWVNAKQDFFTPKDDSSAKTPPLTQAPPASKSPEIEKQAPRSNEERPWIFAEALNLQKPISITTPSVFLMFNITLKNNGSSVATKAYATIRVSTMRTAIVDKTSSDVVNDFRAENERRRVNWEQRKVENPQFGYMIAPGQSVTESYGFGIPNDALDYSPTLEEVRTGSFFVFGYLEYSDVDGSVHSTRFCFVPNQDSVHSWDLKTFVPYVAYQDAN